MVHCNVLRPIIVLLWMSIVIIQIVLSIKSSILSHLGLVVAFPLTFLLTVLSPYTMRMVISHAELPLALRLKIENVILLFRHSRFRHVVSQCV